MSRKDLSEMQIESVRLTAEVWRKRLFDISWFMRALNEYIARAANKEDDCTGHFWEGRFKSQALLDESALAACMAYVDLNPVRAKLAKTPEESGYTSIKYRVQAAKARKKPKRLMPFMVKPNREMTSSLPFTFVDYLQLIDASSRTLQPNKRGSVENDLPPILTRLNIELEQWLNLTTQFERSFKHAAGRLINLERYALNQNLKRVHGRQNALRLLG